MNSKLADRRPRRLMEDMRDFDVEMGWPTWFGADGIEEIDTVEEPSSWLRYQQARARVYAKISNDIASIDQVTEMLAKAGLESSYLILGIDFSSNEWVGEFSFHERRLHHISNRPNPYEEAISILQQTLSTVDKDNLIPCFGFGDASTQDQDIFSFYPDERPCSGFSEALERYRELIPHLHLDGPTSFAPIIEMAMTMVEQSGGKYHVLFIITDGQVTRSVDTAYGQLSSQEQKTIDAIVRASELPLSIVLLGVGDGPWDRMTEFDDNIPDRDFDNLKFIKFSEIMSKTMAQSRKEAAFPLSALLQIPQQYKTTVELGISGRRSMKAPERVPLPPPTGSHDAYSYGCISFSKPQSIKSSLSYPPYEIAHNAATAAPSSAYDNQNFVDVQNFVSTIFGGFVVLSFTNLIGTSKGDYPELIKLGLYIGYVLLIVLTFLGLTAKKMAKPAIRVAAGMSIAAVTISAAYEVSEKVYIKSIIGMLGAMGTLATAVIKWR